MEFSPVMYMTFTDTHHFYMNFGNNEEYRYYPAATVTLSHPISRIMFANYAVYSKFY